MFNIDIKKDIFDPSSDYLTEEIVQNPIISTNKVQENLFLTEDLAARRIQHAWQLLNVKKTLGSDSYRAYISMTDPIEQHWMLSVLMLGQRQSDFKSGLTPTQNEMDPANFIL